MKRIFGAVLAAAVLVLSSCSSEQVDIPATEAEIKRGISEQADIETTVDCPDSIEWETGGDFRCFAETTDGSTMRVTVYMENDEGEWSWQVE